MGVVVITKYAPRPLKPLHSRVVVCSSPRSKEVVEAPSRQPFVRKAVVVETYLSHLSYHRVDRHGVVVLVAGEASNVHKKARAFLGSHVSICQVGLAFGQLLPLFGRDRIIVIAQLNEVKEWFEKKVASTPTPLWLQKQKLFLESCKELIATGGADYDGEDVNPNTLIRVLRGDRDPWGRAVVNSNTPGQKIFLAVYSHGNHVASTHLESSVAGTLDPSHIVPDNEIWYHFMPYDRRPTVFAKNQTFLRLDGSGYKALETIPLDYVKAGTHPGSLIQWQHMAETYKYLFEKKSVANMMVFNHFCYSGGHSQFLTNAHYQNVLKVHRWPLSIVHTAGPFQGGLGDMWPLLFNNITSPANATLPIQKVVEKTLEEYWVRNAVALELNLSHTPEVRVYYGMGEAGFTAASREAAAVPLYHVLGVEEGDLTKVLVDLLNKNDEADWMAVARTPGGSRGFEG